MCRKKLRDSCYCQSEFLTGSSTCRPPWRWTSRGASTPLTRRSPARGARNPGQSPCSATGTPHKHVFRNKSLIKPSAQQILIAQDIIMDMMMTTPAFRTQPSCDDCIYQGTMSNHLSPACCLLLVPPSFYDICQIMSTTFTCYLM